ncbi:extracellular solute-binding protein [Pseudonocardia ailaonensis]|uniref:Extracellular solute-binding protein n=1 Tax=Pseudonocardia ailaonensis TaxID=367279 RepID=A0ABN2N9T1_9PSEU
MKLTRLPPRARAATAIVGAAVALLVAACGSAPAAPANAAETTPEWAQVLSDASREGSAVVYTSFRQNQQDALLDAFHAKYPAIDVQMSRVVAGVAGKIQAEKQTGAAGADVVVTTEAQLPDQLAPAGDLMTIEGPHAEQWKGSPHFDGKSFPATFNVWGLTWNTDQVKQAVTTYRDLLRPDLVGRIGLLDVATGPAVADFYQFLEQTQGPDYLAALARQQPRFYPSAVPLQQAAVAGEVAAIGMVVPDVREDERSGAPVGFALPDPAWAAPQVAFGVTWAKHPNAARVLLDFMMSPEGQNALALNGVSALPGTSGLVPIDKVRISPVAPSTPDAIKQFDARWGELFRK